MQSQDDIVAIYQTTTHHPLAYYNDKRITDGELRIAQRIELIVNLNKYQWEYFMTADIFMTVRIPDLVKIYNKFCRQLKNSSRYFCLFS